MRPPQDEYGVLPTEPNGDLGEERRASVDLSNFLRPIQRRWKLLAIATVLSLVAAHGVLKLVPSLYKSTVEILVYDPQRQIDSAVQKPISPFVDAVGYDAMTTEISVLKSKWVALRVARELHLDRDQEFQPHSKIEDILERLGLSRLSRAYHRNEQNVSPTEAERLDEAADILLGKVDAWPNAYIISVTAMSQGPAKAQLLAATIATDYLASQREARQEALDHVANWLKGRADNIRSRVLETEASIEKLKLESGIRDTESNSVKEQQIRELNVQLMAAREEVDQRRARLEQARRIVESNGDVQSIPELTGSAALAALRQRQTELISRTEDLQSRLGNNHQQVIASRAALAAINKQISTETTHILGTLQNDYNIAELKAQALEANFDRLTAHVAAETYTKLQQLRRLADADHSLYETYLSQYNDISERRTLQDASARIISPATLPMSPSSSRRKLFYGGAGALGLGGGVLLALSLEFRRPGFRTAKDVESFLGRPVVGVIPSVAHHQPRKLPPNRAADAGEFEPPPYVSDAVHALRIGLELSSAHPKKVVLITSALPDEGKSTVAKLLAASSANAGKRTLLLDCDLHQRSASEAHGTRQRLGLSDLLRARAELSEVIVRDPLAKNYVIPAGSLMLNTADWLISERMRSLIDVLRGEFDYIVMDAPPLLPVVDALALSTMANEILFIVAWSQTPRGSISEALRILRPEAQRAAGIVLNKVDLDQMPEHVYGRYYFGAAAAA